MTNPIKTFNFCKVIKAAKYGSLIPLVLGFLALLALFIVESLWVVGTVKAHATVVSKVEVYQKSSKNTEVQYRYTLKLDDASDLEKAHDYHLVSPDDFELGKSEDVRCKPAGECKRDSVFHLWEKSIVISATLLILCGVFWLILYTERRFCR